MQSEAQSLKARAHQAFEDEDFASALILLGQLEQQTGLHAELANNLAVVHYKLGDFRSAVQLFRKALELQGEAQHLVANNLLDILEEQHRALAYEHGSVCVKEEPKLVVLGPESQLVVPRCSLCNQPGVRFLPLPEFYLESFRRYGFVHYGSAETLALETYSCSCCGASDRERLYILWLEQEVAAGRLLKKSRMIHFAPEPGLSRALRSSGFFDYCTADLSMAGVDHHVDLMALPFLDETFDFFICSHVLEHVPDDGLAVRELHRILRSGGCGILMAPVVVGLEQTLEDPCVTDEAERWRLFGQNDHLRLYAHDDYVRKMQSNGFLVEQIGIDHFGVEVFKSLGIKETSILYIVHK